MRICLITPVVLQNRVTGNRWQTEGYLRCTVYYQSEEPGARLLRTEQKFAFEKSVELPAGQYAEGPAQVWGEPEYCNCRAVSEHRIDLRGAYILCAAVAVRRELELLTSLADCGIEQYTRVLQGMQCAVTEEKTLTAESSAALPAAGENVLDITGSFTAGSIVLAAGQASVQGTLQLQICSQNTDSGELTVQQALRDSVKASAKARRERIAVVCGAKGETVTQLTTRAASLNSERVVLTANAKKQAQQLTDLGFGDLPICMAKTQYSFSDDQTLLGAPSGFEVTVRNLKVSAGAGFIVALTGDIMTMPGLPKVPSAEKIDVDENGRITGLF